MKYRPVVIYILLAVLSLYACRKDFILPLLKADFVWAPEIVGVGDTVVFGDNSQGLPESFSWSFQQGKETSRTENDRRVSVVWDEEGVYRVRLIVQDALGDTSQKVIDLIVRPNLQAEISPAPQDSSGFPTIDSLGRLKARVGVPLSVKSTSPGAREFLWIAQGAQPAVQTTEGAAFTYADTGIYNLTLIVSSLFEKDTVQRQVCVVDEPSIAFSANVTTALRGSEIFFFDESRVVGEIKNRTWLFQGGFPETSNEKEPKVSYQNSGTFDVKLCIEDTWGGDTLVKFGYIEIYDAIQAGFTADTLVIEKGGIISFQDTSYGDPTQWEWFFEGGSPSFNQNQNPTVLYEEAGKYDVTLKITNEFGEESTITLIDYITVTEKPSADFTIFPSPAQAGDQVLVIDETQGDVSRRSFSFPGANPSESSENSTIIRYNEAGTYTITLYIWNEFGEVDSSSKELVVYNGLGADFIANKTSASVGEEIQFSDQSEGDPTTWAWEFPGGTPAASNEQNPTVSYPNPGLYTVTLTIQNAQGDEGQREKTEYIEVVGSTSTTLNAEFEADKQRIFVGEEIQFTDLTTGNPVSWSWEFQGASPNTSTNQNPNVSYNTAGTYTVILRVTDVQGAEDTETKTLFIEVLDRLMADFAASPTNAEAGQSVQFTDLSEGIDIITWEWQFEGGTPATSNQQNPSVTYNTPGTYDVLLIIRNAVGEASEQKDNYITITQVGSTNRPPEGNSPQSFQVAQNAPTGAVLGNVLASDPDGDALAFALVGNDPPFVINQNTGAITLSGPLTENSYSFIVRVSDGRGGEVDISVTIGVETATDTNNPPLISSCGANSPSGQVPHSVTFSADASDPDGDNLTYSWDFGDGNTGAGQTPSHTYNSAGSFTATLTVSDGQVDATCQVAITVANPPTVNFPPQISSCASNPTSGSAPLEVAFSVDASDPDGDNLTYSWDFGDGNTANGQNPTHTYQNTGNYTATVTVSDGMDQVSCSRDIEVSGDPCDGQPNASISAAGPFTTDQGAQQLSASPAGGTFSGPGTNASGQFNPSNAGVGTHTITYSVEVAPGCTRTATIDIVVNAANQAPTVSCNSNPNSGDAPLTVSFTASGNDPDGDALAYTWDFGDGNTSNQEDPSHTYNTSGTYIATVTVDDGNGGTDQCSRTITVNTPPAPNQAPTVSCNSNPNSGDAPLTVSFSASGNDPDGDALAYTWDFGDGNTSNQEDPSHTYNTAGTYTATVTVDDGNGGMDQCSRTITVIDQSSVVTCSSNVTSGDAPLTVDFSSSHDNTLGTAISYSWDFGDGNSSTAQNPSHMYNSSGSYNATVTIRIQTISLIVEGSCTTTITVNEPPVNNPPTSSCSATPNTGDTPLTVIFQANASDPDGDNLIYAWVFNDGNASTEENPTHTYTNAGTYNVSLTVSDGVSAPVVCNTTVTVNAPVDPCQGVEEASIIGVALLSTSDGDVQLSATPTGGNYSGTGVSPSGLFSPSTSGAGTHTITYNVEPVPGCIRTTTIDITVQEAPNQPPVANCSITPTSGEEQLTVFQFDGSGSTDTDGTISTYAWDFGDGNTANGITASHSYTNVGGFDVTLTITDDDGATASCTTRIQVNPSSN